MDDSKTSNLDITIITKYVNAKKIAYNFYNDFSKVEEISKKNFLKNLCEELKEVNPDFYG